MTGSLGVDLAQDAQRQQQFAVFAEGLEDDGVDARARQCPQLFGVGFARFALSKASKRRDADAQRTDRRADVNVVALAGFDGLPRQLHSAAVADFDLVRASGAAELVGVGAKCIALDEINAGGDISLVHGKHDVGRVDVHPVEAVVGAGMGFFMQHRAHGAIRQQGTRQLQSFAEWGSAHQSCRLGF